MQIAIAEAKAHFADLIRRVEAGEDIVLTRYGRPVARLVAAESSAQTPALVGCMKGRFAAPEDILSGDAEVAALFAGSEIAPR